MNDQASRNWLLYILCVVLLTALIVEGRPWASVDSLAEIDGISAGMVDSWRSLIKV